MEEASWTPEARTVSQVRDFNVYRFLFHSLHKTLEYRPRSGRQSALQNLS
jgi:hypothetical protein